MILLMQIYDEISYNYLSFLYSSYASFINTKLVKSCGQFPLK